jgi:hypothetical protein
VARSRSTSQVGCAAARARLQAGRSGRLVMQPAPAPPRQPHPCCLKPLCSIPHLSSLIDLPQSACPTRTSTLPLPPRSARPSPPRTSRSPRRSARRSTTPPSSRTLSSLSARRLRLTRQLRPKPPRRRARTMSSSSRTRSSSPRTTCSEYVPSSLALFADRHSRVAACSAQHATRDRRLCPRSVLTRIVHRMVL